MSEQNGAVESKIIKVIYNQVSFWISVLAFLGAIVFGVLRPYTALSERTARNEYEIDSLKNANSQLYESIGSLQKDIKALNDSLVRFTTIVEQMQKQMKVTNR